MNTNQLKKFAQETRRKLLEQVGAKLSFVLTTDSAELREKTEQLKQLREELTITTKDQLIEKVAYVWFNRLMALRFMDANDYQPLGIRIITPKDGYTIPELLDEAKRGNIPEELKVNRQKIFDLLDNKIPSSNPQNEGFKELLIAACNYLQTTFPFLFEKINDYTEILLPDDLTSDFSIVNMVRDGMLIEDCKDVEIIGWLYQFYISEEKERLINAKSIYEPHEIAPVTQLFTPKWIVQYMVDNTLGQFWKECRPNSNIINELDFYIKPKGEGNLPKREVKSPEEITLFDPCVGSAHILCYAFDIFYKIYREEGYNDSEIAEHILTKNLFGLDIDDRAAQLAGFALMMKGRQYNRRFLRNNIIPNITAFQNIESHPTFENSKTFGSLIKITQHEVDEIEVDENSIFSEQQKQLKKQAQFLSNKYDIFVTNPPYLNSTFMEGELKQFVEKNYSFTKLDLFACFLVQSTHLTKYNGLIGFLCPYVWMFILSFQKLREFIISNTTINNLIQLEYNAFGPAVVPVCTFTLRNKSLNDFEGIYIKLSDFKGVDNQEPKTLEAIKNPQCGWLYYSNQVKYQEITGNPIGYWLDKDVYKIFQNSRPLKEMAEARKGITSGLDARFIRYWYEVNYDNTSININPNDSKFYSKKFYPINKGGGFRRWYGNLIDVCNWENNGYEIRNFKDENGRYKSRPQNLEYAFREGVTWNAVSNIEFSCRYVSEGCLFSDVGPTIFNLPNPYLYMAFLNSEHANLVFQVLCPTMKFEVGQIQIFPLPDIKNLSVEIESLAKECVRNYKDEWDAKETSMDFDKPLLLIHRLDESIENANDSVLAHIKIKIKNQFEIENRINQLFSDCLGLKNRKVKPSTIRLYDDLFIDGVADPKELLNQFISYAVGCMFGRYSLDKEGLILVNQGESQQGYPQRISRNDKEYAFLPDADNIIPILNDEWFEDDIVGKFHHFLKLLFGENNFNKNIAFIEEQFGKDIRKYFIKDFYPNHIKRYKKRPIYWMFSSPKGSFNVIIYIHRYTPDTVSNILNKYLKEFIGKLNTRKEHLQHVQVTGSVSDKTKAIKEIDYIEKTLVELHEYERDVLYPLATERLEIDLDDGVLVNYNKFGKAVKEVNGINDHATKKKVKQFDWIDTSQIR